MVLAGKLSIREEESPKLLVDRVLPVESWANMHKSQAYQPPRQVATRTAVPPMSDAQRAASMSTKWYIRLEQAQIPQAQQVLANYPGDIPVYLHLPSQKVTLLMPATHWSNGSAEALQELRSLFGEENVKPVEK